jgi:hypothetical protein
MNIEIKDLEALRTRSQSAWASTADNSQAEEIAAILRDLIDLLITEAKLDEEAEEDWSDQIERGAPF